MFPFRSQCLARGDTAALYQSTHTAVTFGLCFCQHAFWMKLTLFWNQRMENRLFCGWSQDSTALRKANLPSPFQELGLYLSQFPFFLLSLGRYLRSMPLFFWMLSKPCFVLVIRTLGKQVMLKLLKDKLCPGKPWMGLSWAHSLKGKRAGTKGIKMRFTQTLSGSRGLYFT